MRKEEKTKSWGPLVEKQERDAAFSMPFYRGMKYSKKIKVSAEHKRRGKLAISAVSTKNFATIAAESYGMDKKEANRFLDILQDVIIDSVINSRVVSLGFLKIENTHLYVGGGLGSYHTHRLKFKQNPSFKAKIVAAGKLLHERKKIDIPGYEEMVEEKKVEFEENCKKNGKK